MCADLTITKVSDAGGLVFAGQRITYTITVANPGPGTHSGVVVADPLPAGTSWVSTQITRFVEGLPQTVGDTFDSETYAANSGTINWAGPWVETNDDGSPDHGGIVIHRHDGRTTLELQESDRRITRAADLSAYGRAVLSYDWKRRDLDAGEWVAIEVSGDGGASWTEVARHSGPGDDAGFTTETGVDVSAFTTAGFQIRLRTAPGQEGNHELRVDDLFVEAWALVPSIGPGGAPPALNPPTTLLAGESMTITLVVEVDDPLAPGIGEIVNAATVTSDQQAMARSAATHDLVTVANRAPVAGDDGPLVADEDQPLLVAGAVLLANDSDPDGQPLVVVSADATSHAGGTVTDNGDGTFTYTPPADWSGTDWFDYTVSDGIATDTGTVVITVVR